MARTSSTTADPARAVASRFTSTSRTVGRATNAARAPYQHRLAAATSSAASRIAVGAREPASGPENMVVVKTALTTRAVVAVLVGVAAVDKMSCVGGSLFDNKATRTRASSSVNTVGIHCFCGKTTYEHEKDNETKSDQTR